MPSIFTLLFQDSAGGLEFANREEEEEEGGFLPAVPDGDKLHLNIGDMLMQLSNGKPIHPAPSSPVIKSSYRPPSSPDFNPSATHRVTIPDVSASEAAPPKTRAERYSIPYFLLPDADAVVVQHAARLYPSPL